MRTLTIISHTEHFKNHKNEIVGLVSTVTEINHLLDVFDKIIHVAPLHKGLPPKNTEKYRSSKIEFIPIKPSGGTSVGSKIGVILIMFHVLKMVNKGLQKADVFQFRAPTGIGVYVIPYLMFLTKTSGWYKYAGNWRQADVPWSYRFQRWLLKRQKLPVTINGVWPDQPTHCISFENPCLSGREIEEGYRITINKTLPKDLVELCFVGRLESQKGFDVLVNAVAALPDHWRSKISRIHCVGQQDTSVEMKIDAAIKPKFDFHGVLPRHEVHKIYQRSHALVLPSKSEGFPKVIIEALNFGCLPIVTQLSGITTYINHKKNGLLLESATEQHTMNAIIDVLKMSDIDYHTMLEESRSLVKRFTYDNYNKRVEQLLNNFSIDA